jgi:2-succinyl-5-enolpyruvyl-6-hydroxy-3-cyclohexene-1-carboxylate synthase
VLDKNESEIIQRWKRSELAFTEHLETESSSTSKSSDKVFEIIRAARSPLIVCGPLKTKHEKESVANLAFELKCPVLADINSDLRFSTAQQQVFGLYNLYLRKLQSDNTFPDVVLLCGDRIVSEEVRMYLEAAGATVVAVSEYAGRQDLIENESIRTNYKVSTSVTKFFAQYTSEQRETSETVLLEAFSSFEEQVKEKLDSFLDAGEAIGEAASVRTIFESVTDGMAVYLSASLLFREADFFVSPRQVDLHTSCNRGATGIDGVLSSAIGYSLANERPTVVLIGEQALLHDLNALALLANCPSRLFVFLVQNGGGAIFDFFDLGASNETMRNYQTVSFENIAAAFQLPYHKPACQKDLELEFRKAQKSSRCAFFELEIGDGYSVKRVKSAPSLLL